jgi:LacI family transcriptional regulator
MNIYDIAQEAGVSIATVSRVLNGSPKVKKSTRQKVEGILERSRYSPSIFARGMVSGSMSTIGVLTIDVRDLYFGDVTYSIEHAFLESGYNTILCNTGGLPEQQLHYLSLLTAKNVDGIILVGSVFDDRSLEAAVLEVSKSIPVVMLNRLLQGPNIRSVICDEEAGLKECVAHLVRSGHRRIFYIRDTDTDSAMRKLSGFRAGMREAGLDPDTVIVTGRGLGGGMDAVAQLSGRGAEYTALVTGDDVTAAGVCKGLRRIGRRPGIDTAVSGCNDSIIALSCEPELTSVDTRSRQMGETAVSILSQVLKGEEPPGITMVKPGLSIRKSTLTLRPEQ